MADLSILIPARNEIFLKNTVEDILKHIEADTEIIVACDGNWPDPPVKDHERVTMIYHSQSVGQRAATNEAAKFAKSKYLMKCDAHCAFDQGFDRKLLADIQDNWTIVPTMRNLHVFNWICPNGHTRYQGPSGPCTVCGEPTVRDIVWISKHNPQSRSYCFDATPHFQYFKEYTLRPEFKGSLTETMSLQGSCFMLTRDKYFELNICDEAFGSWGSQGIEVAVKTWLSGGKVIVDNNTWYAHCFRTQGGDFGFPYELSGRQVENAKKYAKNLFFSNRWPKQVYPLSWLIEKFWPVPGWTEADLTQVKANDHVVKSTSFSKPESSPTKGIVYYTDNYCKPEIRSVVQKQIDAVRGDKELVTVSLKPISWGNNIVYKGERGPITLFKQILAGLEASKADIIFFCEADVLYHKSHFDFVPPRIDVFYYNENTWKVDWETGRAIFYHAKQTSGLCAYRELLLEHYRERVKRVEKDGFKGYNGFEPGTHTIPRGFCDHKAERWMSEVPNIDIRHDRNLIPTRWEQSQFRSPRSCRGWTQSDEVPGWGIVKERFQDMLKDIVGI